MRNLKYAILGLLNQKPMSGYDIMKEFETTLSEFWHATHSQIYPELKKLTEEGMVEYDVEIVGTTLERKLYTITKAGHEDFMQWMSKEVEAQPTPKDINRLKVFFSSSFTNKQRKDFFDDLLKMHQDRLEHLVNNGKKFDKVPKKDSPEFGDYLLLMGAVMREENTCEWIKRCMEIL